MKEMLWSKTTQYLASCSYDIWIKVIFNGINGKSIASSLDFSISLTDLEFRSQ